MNQKSFVSKPKRRYPWEMFKDRRRTVGVLSPCYGSAHVIYGLPCQRYKHESLLVAPLKFLDKQTTYFEFTPWVIDASLPLLHTWNTIPLNRDFIVSFELELPRYLGTPSEAQIVRAMSMLNGGRCKGILALSQFAYDSCKRQFERHGFPQLTQKMSIFRGAVVDPVANGSVALKLANRLPFDQKPFSAVVIGTELFRKGGMYSILAFERLRAQGIDVRLTLVGRFEQGSYVFQEFTPDAAQWIERARAHDWITIKGSIPNAEVFTELLSHDICLYPSLDESLGWLVIEAGMLGVPILGNRICAFPELIEHRKTGWLIDLPVRDDGRWVAIDRRGDFLAKSLEESGAAIVDGIETCVHHLLRTPEDLVNWGREGRQKMVSMYSMESAGQQLESIYDRVLMV